MEDKKYQVLFYGEILPGADLESVKDNLAKAFRVDKDKIDALFSGKKKVVKKDATRDLCEKTKKIFEAAGAVASVVPQGAKEAPPPPPTDVEPDTEPAVPPAEPLAAAATASLSPDNNIGKSLPETTTSGKVNKATLLLLTFFLGFIGVHKFYLAKNIQGFLFLIFSWTCIPGLIAMIEFFIYAFAGEEKLNSKYKTGSTPLVIIMAVLGPFIFMALVGIIMAIAIPLFLVSHKNDIVASAMKMVKELPAASSGKTSTMPLPQQASARIPVTKPDTAASSAAASPEKEAAVCSGKIKGLDFFVEHASVKNGVLHLKQGKEFFADREIIIFMFLENKDMSNQQIVASADKESYSDPHIHLRWKTDDGTPQSDVVMKGYDLNLKFGPVTRQTVRVRIDLTMPGEQETSLAGTFTAEVAEK